MLSEDKQRALAEGQDLSLNLFLSRSISSPAALTHALSVSDDGRLLINATGPANDRKVTDMISWIEAGFNRWRELLFIDEERAEDWLLYMRDCSTLARIFGFLVLQRYDELHRANRIGQWPNCRMMPREVDVLMQAVTAPGLPSGPVLVDRTWPNRGGILRLPQPLQQYQRPTAARPSSGEVCRNHNQGRCRNARCRYLHVCFAPECHAANHVLRDCTVVSGQRKSALLAQLTAPTTPSARTSPSA